MAIFAFIWMIRAALVGTFFPLTEDGKIVYGNLFPGDFTIDPPVRTGRHLREPSASGLEVKNMIDGFQGQRDRDVCHRIQEADLERR